MSEYIKKGNTWEGIPDQSNNFRKDVFKSWIKSPLIIKYGISP